MFNLLVFLSIYQWCVRMHERTHQFSQRLFCFFPCLHVDAKVGQMQDELSVDAFFIARVAKYVWPSMSGDNRPQEL